MTTVVYSLVVGRTFGIKVLFTVFVIFWNTDYI